MDFKKDTPQDRVNNRKSLSEVARSTPTTRYNSRPSYYRRRTNLGPAFVAASVVVAMIGLTGAYVALHPERDVTVKVVDKVRTGGDDSKYLIFTDGGVYEDTDTMMKGKYNSSDLYSKIQVGQRYTFHLRGVRSGFFSMYPNIITVKTAK